jgi:cytochrome c-type biogenesis protein CcmH
MSERVRNIVFAVAIAVTAVLTVTLVATTPTDTDRIEQLGSQIKCPVCQGESIANSPADMARDMMGLVEERVAEGATDQQIVDELLASYSGAVLLDPPASGSTLILWLAPIAALAVGIAVIAWWRRHPGETVSDEAPAPARSRSRSRTLIGGLILAGAFAAIVVAASLFVSDDSGSTTAASTPPTDLASVSNETMEAVIAENLDNPQVNGMRLALAERYFESNDYRSAFPHFLAVAESTDATSSEAVTALVRLGWMAWDGNGEAETAVGLFDQALRIDPSGTTAAFLKARVHWCGLDDPEGAEALLEQVSLQPQLDSDSLALVEADLTAIRNGEPCS